MSNNYMTMIISEGSISLSGNNVKISGINLLGPQSTRVDEAFLSMSVRIVQDETSF